MFTQIEGFKLHVVHNLRPFVNRIRYTPEVASKPDRLEKDLANAKVLAGILEDEAAALRKTQPQNGATRGHIEGVEGENSQVERKEGITMTEDHSVDGVDDDDEPRERGSEAVERRIEKVVAEARDQGLVDVNDEKAFHTMKVCSFDILRDIIRLTLRHRQWCLSTCTWPTCELRSTHVTTVPL